MIFDSFINWFAFFWFLVSWITYTLYAKNAGSSISLSKALFKYRLEWTRNVVRSENRASDFMILRNLTNIVNFLATTSIFAIAGLITVIYSTDEILKLLSEHAFVAETNREQIQFKILVLITVFVFAFFQL